MSAVRQSDEEALSVAPREIRDLSGNGRQLEFDDEGHAIMPTEAERAEDHRALLVALAEMAAIPDDPAESDEELWRAIDAARPERPLFRELYEP